MQKKLIFGSENPNEMWLLFNKKLIIFKTGNEIKLTRCIYSLK